MKALLERLKAYVPGRFLDEVKNSDPHGTHFCPIPAGVPQNLFVEL
jgi:hypothetical protein